MGAIMADFTLEDPEVIGAQLDAAKAAAAAIRPPSSMQAKVQPGVLERYNEQRAKAEQEVAALTQQYQDVIGRLGISAARPGITPRGAFGVAGPPIAALRVPGVKDVTAAPAAAPSADQFAQPAPQLATLPAVPATPTPTSAPAVRRQPLITDVRPQPGGIQPYEGAAEELPAATLPPATGAAPAVPSAAAKPARSLTDEYRDAMKEMNKVDTSGTLTPEQRKRHELMFWLQVMAHGSEPGARLFGAMGKAGTTALTGMSKEEEKNRQVALDKLKSSKEDVYRLAQLADKQGDNERADRQLAMMQSQHERTDKRTAERIKLERERLDQDKIKVFSSPTGWVAYDTKNVENTRYVTINGKVVMPPPSAAPADRRDEFTKQMEGMEKFSKKPQAEQDRLLAIADRYKGAGKPVKGQITDDDRLNKAIALKAADMSGKMTLDAALAEINRVFPKEGGAPAAAGGPQKPATEDSAHAQAKAAIQQGAKKDDVNARLKAWGYRTI